MSVVCAAAEVAATNAATPATASGEKGALASFAAALSTVDGIAGNFLSLGWKALVLIVFLVCGWLAFNEWKRNPLIVEPMDVPPELLPMGLSGSVMAQLLYDHLFDLQRAARIDDDASDIVFVELPKLQVDLQLPGTAWSIRGLVRYLKQSFGSTEKRLLGEVLVAPKGYVIRLRTPSGRVRAIPVVFRGVEDLSPAMRAAADVAMMLTDPLGAASIFHTRESFRTGFARTIEALQLHLAWAPASTHQDAYVVWASIHRMRGEGELMHERLRQAGAVSARLWSGQQQGTWGIRYRNFVGSVHREHARFDQAKEMFQSALLFEPRHVGAMSNLGLLFVDLWQLDDAELWFRRVVRYWPNSGRGYRGLGLVAQRRGRMEEALQFFNRAIDVAPQSRWSRINRIELLSAVGDQAAIKSALDDFQRLDPEFPPLLRLWAKLLVDNGHLDEALEKADQALQGAPFDIWNRIRRAEVLIKLGRVDHALKAASFAMELDHRHPGAGRQYAEVLAESGRLDEALSILESNVRMAPREPWGQAMLAEHLRKRGRLSAASRVLDEVPTDLQLTPDILRARGWRHVSLGDLGRARSFFQFVLDRVPSEPWAALGLAHVLVHEGRHAEARQHLSAIRNRRPRFIGAWRLEATIWQYEGNLEKALEVVHEALRIGPHDPWTVLQAAETLQRLDRFSEAMTLLSQLHAERPENAEALRRWGEVARDAGDTSLAITLLERAVATGTAEVWTHLSLASQLRQVGRVVEGREVIDAAIGTFRELPQPLEAKADVLMHAGDRDGAESLLKTAIEMAPSEARTLRALADLHRKVGEWDDMLEVAQKVMALRPQHAAGWMQAAEASERLGLLPEARALYLGLLAIHPWHRDARLALARIAERGVALEQVRHVLASYPTDVTALRLSVQLLPDPDPPRSFIRLMRSTLAHHGDNARVLMELSEVYRMSGEPARALVCALRAGRLQAGWSRAHELEGLAFIALNRTSEARRSFKRVLRLLPANQLALFYLAQIASKAGNHREVIYRADALLRLQENDAYMLGLRGRSHLRLKDFEAARADLQLAAALAPNNRFAEDGVRELQKALVGSSTTSKT